MLVICLTNCPDVLNFSMLVNTYYLYKGRIWNGTLFNGNPALIKIPYNIITGSSILSDRAVYKSGR